VSKEDQKSDDHSQATPSTQPQSEDKKIESSAIGDDISPESLLEVISQEWKAELERLKQKGLNGYRRRKESRHESLV
jgi:hypothetical protein